MPLVWPYNSPRLPLVGTKLKCADGVWRYRADIGRHRWCVTCEPIRAPLDSGGPCSLKSNMWKSDLPFPADKYLLIRPTTARQWVESRRREFSNAYEWVWIHRVANWQGLGADLARLSPVLIVGESPNRLQQFVESTYFCYFKFFFSRPGLNSVHRRLCSAEQPQPNVVQSTRHSSRLYFGAWPCFMSNNWQKTVSHTIWNFYQCYVCVMLRFEGMLPNRNRDLNHIFDIVSIRAV